MDFFSGLESHEFLEIREVMEFYISVSYTIVNKLDFHSTHSHVV